jgi:hypothetical protein
MMRVLFVADAGRNIPQEAMPTRQARAISATGTTVKKSNAVT